MRRGRGGEHNLKPSFEVPVDKNGDSSGAGRGVEGMSYHPSTGNVEMATSFRNNTL